MDIYLLFVLNKLFIFQKLQFFIIISNKSWQILVFFCQLQKKACTKIYLPSLVKEVQQSQYVSSEWKHQSIRNSK